MTGNALIKSTMLGIEDHGIMTCYLMLQQSSAHQGFGGYGLDGPFNEATKQRDPNKLCGFWVQRILETVGVEKWEDLPGKHIRVAGDYHHITGIGHITDDKWFYPKAEIATLQEASQ